MKTELERYKEAVKVAIFNLRSLGLDFAHFTQQAETQIEAIINPPPETETVEVVEWAILRPKGFIDHFGDEDSAVRCRDNHYHGCPIVKLTGTIQRPKPQPVEKSVSVEGHINAGGYAYLDRQLFECSGKTGTITFTWQEDAK